MELISATTAAKILGVKLPTLYSYVSRGLIRSHRKAKDRTRYYDRADVERIKAKSHARSGHGAVAASALRWGEPVLESAITRITDTEPLYRGYGAIDLAAQDVPFENVAEMLWSGMLSEADIFWDLDKTQSESQFLQKCENRYVHPNDFLFRMLPYLLNRYALETGDPPTETLDSFTRHARRIYAMWAHSLHFLQSKDHGARSKPSTISELVTCKLLGRMDDEAAKLVNKALILCADHELTPSTFAARVAASTGADFFSCLVAATGALAGPLHGGTFARMEQFLEEAKRSGGVKKLIKTYDRKGKSIPGFQHQLYESGDPRARPLLEAASQIVRPGKDYQHLQELLDVAQAKDWGSPAVDLGLLSITLALKLPKGSAAALFAMGRLAGWTAHIIEQRLSGFMLRPRARYVGR